MMKLNLNKETRRVKKTLIRRFGIRDYDPRPVRQLNKVVFGSKKQVKGGIN